MICSLQTKRVLQTMSQAGMLGVLYLTSMLDKTNDRINIRLHNEVALPQSRRQYGI
jgi:hypothetical protein